MGRMLGELYYPFRLATPQKKSHGAPHSDSYQHFTSESDCFIIRFLFFSLFKQEGT